MGASLYRLQPLERTYHPSRTAFQPALANDKHFPAHSPKPLDTRAVTGDVSLDFGVPIAGVRFRWAGHLANVPVPETAVYKHNRLEA